MITAPAKENRTVWSALRTVAGWGAILCFLIMFVAEHKLNTMNPLGANTRWPEGLPRPSSLEMWLWWRNWSCLASLALGLVSLPRWQSLVGLSLTLVFTFYIVITFD